jgi:hypothetical protein
MTKTEIKKIVLLNTEAESLESKKNNLIDLLQKNFKIYSYPESLLKDFIKQTNEHFANRLNDIQFELNSLELIDKRIVVQASFGEPLKTIAVVNPIAEPIAENEKIVEPKKSKTK